MPKLIIIFEENQIIMVENASRTSNIFSSFPEYSMLRGTGTQTNAKIASKPMPSVSVDKVEIEASQAKKAKRRKILFGSTLASTILTTGIVSLLLLSGGHSGALKTKLDKYKLKLAQDLHEAGQISAKDIPSRFAYSIKKGTKKTLDMLQSSSNINTFKDWGSNEVLHTNKVTGTFADKCTAFFKKVVDRTLGKKYDKVEVSIRDMSSLLKQYDIKTLRGLDQTKRVKVKGKTMTLGECIDILEAQTQRLENAYTSNFSKGARKARDAQYRVPGLADLPQKIKDRFFKDKNSLFNIENYRTYATEDLAKPLQESLRRDITRAKKEVTNNIPSITENMKTTLNSFATSVNPKDSASIASVKKLKTQIEKFAACSGPNESKTRETVSKEISGLIDDIIAATKDNSIYSETEQKLMKQLLEEIKDGALSTGNNSKGALEEILTVLNALGKEKIIPNDSLKNYTKMADKITKGLKDATELEAGEYFLKQAELVVGSAPNDVISVLLPVGVGAAAIAKGDDKDEKISATLTTVIPLVGTFATFVLGTVKMFSGAKNLIFSGVSGMALGALGNYADKLYKKYKDSGSITNVVKGEYDKIWTGLEPQMKQFDEPVNAQSITKIDTEIKKEETK